MEITEHGDPTSALQRKPAGFHQNLDLDTPKSKKLKGLPRRSDSPDRAPESREQSAMEQQSEPHDGGEIESEDEEGSDRADVEKKIAALQRIVPGGEELGVDKLFEETAGYILTLQCQVKAMRALTSFFEGLERNKRKLGG
ncbi:hypothetical protein SAY86_011530 [Trapa natans]|uniref:Uncharacterized protein n=1 Tax=Trapa natans TaxID=22666 RepID=A0AAN7R2W3_TRANT|nr:hypothetical protein SAY86_011530 [Trapa natans]